MTAIKHAVQTLSSRLSTEYSRGFDEFIKRPRHLCTVTHKAMVRRDYPGGHCMWVSVSFSDSLNHAFAARPGNHFKIAMPLSYCIEFNVNVMHAYLGAGIQLGKHKILKGASAFASHCF